MAAVLAAAAIVAGIAIVDSLNPGTIGPALVLAVSAKPARRILEFAAGVFLVNVVGGALIMLGPGHWLISLTDKMSHDLKHGLMVVAGVALLCGAVALLAFHERLTRPKADTEQKRGRSGSAFAFGAGLALVELPTAFPYFIAIAAIVEASIGLVGELVLIVLFNLLFLLPLVVIAVLIHYFPDTWGRFIDPVRRWMRAHWPQVLAAVLAVGGAALLVAGLSS